MNREFYQLNLVLLLKALIMLAFIACGNIGLGPDEAQYWTWSQQLDWGYYSKPPGIAWQIWLGTQLFGNTELGVRFFSVIFSYLLSLLVYGISLKSGLSAKTALWAGLIMALTPLGIISSFLAITDIGMVLCWAAATLLVVQALSEKKAPHYILLGIILFVGALFKWPIYIFWLVFLPFVIFFPFLRSYQIIWALLLSLFGLFPSLIWNASHDWVTFRHVLSTVMGGHAAKANPDISQGNWIEFVGAQVALLSPIFSILLLFAYFHLIRRFKTISAPLLFCGLSSLLILIGFGLLSFFQKIQGNWSDFVYPPAIVFLTWYAMERLSLKYLIIGVITSILLCLAIFALPTVQSKGIWSDLQIPYKTNPFKHNLGWHQLDPLLKKMGYQPENDFLFSDKYQTTSILSFYGPSQKRAYFLNLHGIRKNQFSFWPGMEEQKGKTGYFVLVDNQPYLEKDLSKHIEFYQSRLADFFDQVELIGVYTLFESYDRSAKGAIIFKGIDYNGTMPPDVQLY